MHGIVLRLWVRIGSKPWCETHFGKKQIFVMLILVQRLIEIQRVFSRVELDVHGLCSFATVKVP